MAARGRIQYNNKQTNKHAVCRRVAARGKSYTVGPGELFTADPIRSPVRAHQLIGSSPLPTTSPIHHIPPPYLPTMANVVQQVLHATKTVAISAFQTVVSSSSEYVKPSVDAVVAAPTSPAAKNVLGDYVQPHIDPVLAKVHEVSLQVWEGGPGFGFNGTGLKEIFKTALDYITPALEYIEKHPWVLIPFLIPALDAWLFYIGFRAAGIVAGNAPFSLFCFSTYLLLSRRFYRRGAPIPYWQCPQGIYIRVSAEQRSRQIC